MTDRVVLVPTSVGPTAATISKPDGPPRATLLMLQGDGPPGRSGVNAVWTRFARELAGMGVTVVRFEYSNEADGMMLSGDFPDHVHKRELDLIVLRDVVAWLRERLDGDELLLAGDCQGGRLAIDLGREDSDVRGAFLNVPYVRKGFIELDERRRPVGRLRRLFGRIDPASFHEDVLDSLPRMLGRGPVWMLVGEGDGDEPQQLRRLCGWRRRSRIEVEVVRGMAVHPVATPDVQREVVPRMLRRIGAAIGWDRTRQEAENA